LGKSSGDNWRKKMTNIIQRAFGRLTRKAEGEFEVVIIDEFTREERNVKKTNVEVRTGSLYPKQGDLMQVARYCFGSSGSIYTPARVVGSWFQGFGKVYIDMVDWRIPQIRSMDKFYEAFKSPLRCEVEEYKRVKAEEKRLQREGVDYEVILVDSERTPLARKAMSASGEDKSFMLSNYQIGMSPFPETLDANLLFGDIGGLLRDELIVDAVLHPLVGLPKVLVKEGKGKTILDL